MLNNIWKIIFLILFLSCAKDKILNSNNSLNPDNLNIITWNIQNFPKTTETVEHVAQIINSLDVNIIALQEIENLDSIARLQQLLGEDWAYEKSTTSFYGNLAFLINTDKIQYENPYLINNQSEGFATRMPYILPFSYNSTNFTLINIIATIRIWKLIF